MAEPSAPEAQERLGAILVRSVGLPLRTLQEALDRQRLDPDRLVGEILLEMGAIDAAQLEDALAAQALEVSMLGAILVRSAGLALRDLQAALDRQKEEPGTRLGEILLDMQAIDTAQLASALARQKQLRSDGRKP